MEQCGQVLTQRLVVWHVKFPFWMGEN
jgi:hypothetical protein